MSLSIIEELTEQEYDAESLFKLLLLSDPKELIFTIHRDDLETLRRQFTLIKYEVSKKENKNLGILKWQRLSTQQELPANYERWKVLLQEGKGLRIQKVEIPENEL